MFGVRFKVADPKLRLPGSGSNHSGKTGDGPNFFRQIRLRIRPSAIQAPCIFNYKEFFFVHLSFKTLTPKINNLRAQ